MNYQSIPPELLEQMLALSTAEDEVLELEKQQALARALTENAVKYDKGPSSPLGGAAFAIGKGLSGYMGGKMYKEGKTAMESIRNRQREGRRSMFRSLYPTPFYTGTTSDIDDRPT
jgi:hypothetical protein